MGARGLALLILVGVLAAGCGGAADDPDTGRKVFAEAGCEGCHTLSEAGATAQIGPNLDQVKPGTVDVITRVLRGGNGMPSFKGKLSDEQIRAVAGYVSDAAQRAGDSVAAAFRPDDTEVSDCTDDNDPECYQQAFGNLVLERGVPTALDAVEEQLRAARLASGDCHRVLHFVGAAAVARHRGEVAKALMDGEAICASGYYHGVIERGFAGVERADLPARSAEMCADPAITRRAFEHFQCLHGLGHGLMLQTTYDLPFALETCDSLGDDFGRKSCDSGVFMENFTSSYGVQSEYLRADDPVYPCNDVPERHKFPCYQHVTIPILDSVGNDLEEASHVCAERSEPDWTGVCFQSLGRDIASVIARDPGDAIVQCKVAGEWAGECLYGVARNIANDDAAVERASRFCRRVPERHGERCFVGVGLSISTLQPRPRDRVRTCRRLAGPYRVGCFKGAGVWNP